MTKMIREKLNSFHKLIGEYLKSEESKKLEKIETLYDFLKNNLPKDSDELQAVEALKSLLKS